MPRSTSMRLILAALMAFDALFSARSLLPSHTALFAAPALLSLVLFARRPAQSLWGWISLISVGVLVESMSDGPMRFLFFSGTALLGWLFGLACARWQRVDDAEALAESGALATLAAAYLGALLDKLATPGWTDGLRPILASQHVWGHARALDAITAFILAHEGVARALAIFTLVAQASAVLLPFSGRGKTLSAILLLAFHGGIWLLTPIAFPQAMILVGAFGFRKSETPMVASPPSRRAIAAVALVVVAAWLPWTRAFTQKPRLIPAPPPTASSLARLGDLAEGASVGEFRVERIDEPEPEVLRLLLHRRTRWLVVEIVPHGRRSFRPPRTTGSWDLFFQESDLGFDERQRVLEAIAQMLRPA
jgi:hypothetical protein